MRCTAAVMTRRAGGGRTCRGVWECPARHLWWRWDDDPDSPWEPCPHPVFGS